ncbi:TonB-dependent receptor [Altericroceibacterium endophyticum]|uniref:TonB-dependent receptor n=1 Tax=Altericroceibacterium endophyticum TaxID=1808508 RepID=A0A6I4TAL1_9SPHN|nr:TonB-dependent receptor [Altericroceibacterium endophyticum]MXO67063.1 TonB-dependent receptor [Altericroceibacterium endophyticum]
MFEKQETICKLLRGAALTPLMAASIIAVPAMAQDDAATPSPPVAPAGNGQIQEIVVTAQFRDQNLQDTPLAITAIDSALIEARSQSNIEDVAKSAPSVQFTSGGQGGGAQTAAVNIRGIGASDFLFPNEPGVGIYIDDVYYGISLGSAFDLVDLDRVEVLRGPQGTLSGKNSIGGSIKMFSRKPDDDPDAYVQAEYGSYDRMQISGGTNITLAQDRLYARVTGLARSVDGFVKRLDYNCANDTDTAPGGTFALPTDNCVIGTEGGQNVFALRGALRFIANENIENTLTADYTKDHSEASPSKSIIYPSAQYITGPEEYTNYANYTGYPGTPEQFTNPAISYVTQWGIANTLDWQMGDNLALKSITAFRKTKGRSSWDGDNSPEHQVNDLNIFRHEQFTQELRLSADLGDMIDATIGGYYYNADSVFTGRVSNGAAGLDFVPNDPFDQESKSGFIHLVISPTDTLNFTGGLRYTKEDKTYTFSRSSAIPGDPVNPLVAPLDGLVGEFHGSHWDYRIAADYEFYPDIRLYAQIATGFKGGGVNPRPFTASQLVPYGQETSTSYEVGLKSFLFDRHLRLNLAAYHTDYNDYQGQVSSCPDISPPGFPFCSATLNVADADIDGFEAEFDFRPGEGLSFDGSVSYTDFQFTNPKAGSGIIAGETRPIFVPKWKYALGAQYEIGLGNRGTLRPRLDYAWQSDMESTIPNGVPGFTFGTVDSYGVLNARITYLSPDDDWEMALAATNLTDKFYYANKFDRFTQSGNVYGTVGRPREIRFSVKRRFN